jgi:uncharacterized protein (DUF2141 family)
MRLCLILIALTVAPGADLTIVVNHLKANQGKVYIGLYSDPSAFPTAGKQWRGAVVEPQGESAVAELHDVPAGTYAVAVYQDLNGNGVLDKNFVGQPKEPYGFSNNGSGKTGKPSFPAAAFEVKSSPVEVKIDLH